MKERITRYAMRISLLCLIACMGCENYAELKSRDYFVEDEEYKEYAEANWAMCNNRLYRHFMAAAQKEMGYANAYILWSSSGSHSDPVFSGVLRRGNELYALTVAEESKFAFAGPLEDKRLLAKFKWLMQNKRDMFALREKAVSDQMRYRASREPHMLFARDSSGETVSQDIEWYFGILDRVRDGELYNIEEHFDSGGYYNVEGYQFDVRVLRHAKRLGDWCYGARSLLDAIHLEYAEKTHTSLGSVPYRADANTPWCESDVGDDEDDEGEEDDD